MVRASVVGFLSLLVILNTAAAQDEPNDELKPIGGLAFVDQLEVTVVNIPVFVTDKKGNAITDLTQEDFRILQDGQERVLTNFKLYTEEVYESYRDELRQIEAAGRQHHPDVVNELPELRPSYMAIYVDHENLRPLDRNRVLNQLATFVRENCKPPIQMMVASYNRSLKVVQPFTSDSNEVMEALRQMRKTTGGRTNRDSERKDIYDQMEREKQENRGSSSGQMSGQGSHSRVYGQVAQFAEEELNNLQFTLGALRETLTMLSGLPGKKSMLYISNGLPMVPGMDMFYGMANAYNDPSLITQGTRYNQYRQFDSLVSTANAQGVTFYTIDASGLQAATGGSAEYASPMDTEASSVMRDNYKDSIRFMADGTGGVAIFNSNDIRGRMSRIEQDFYVYYSLGYSLQSSGSDKVHKIKVELPNHPDYRLRYRRRMVEKSMETRVHDRVVTGLMFDLDENPMGITCETGNPSPASEGRWTVPFELQVPIDLVAMLPEGEDYVGRVTMFVAVRDNKGKQSDVVRQEHELRVPIDSYDSARGKYYTIVSRLLMEKGSYRVAVGLYDPLTRQASYQTLATAVGD
jgi:VWFA-related protein